MEKSELSGIISKFAAWEADTIIGHADVVAHRAPSECHADVQRYSLKKLDALEKKLNVTMQQAHEAFSDELGEKTARRAYNNLIAVYIRKTSIWRIKLSHS